MEKILVKAHFHFVLFQLESRFFILGPSFLTFGPDFRGRAHSVEKTSKIFKCRIWLNSKLFRRGYATKKVKNTVPWTYVITDLKGREIVGTFFCYDNSFKGCKSYDKWIDVHN